MSTVEIMNRFRGLIKERGYSLTDAARKLDVSPQVLSAWLSGRNKPNVEAIANICSVFSLSPSWLMTGRFDSPDHQTVITDDFIGIPLLNFSASCGNGREISEDAVVSLIRVNRNWISRHCGNANSRALNIISVSGDSMNPTLNDGDFVIIDTSVTYVDTDSLFAFSLDNDLFIKRIQRAGRNINVISDNPLYPPYTLTSMEMEHGFRVFGRVVTTCLVRRV